MLVNVAGLLHEDCIAKMRLLTLVALGMTESSQIPYSMIRDTLQVLFYCLYLVVCICAPHFGRFIGLLLFAD